jgi:hypothetical protein
MPFSNFAQPIPQALRQKIGGKVSEQQYFRYDLNLTGS